MLLSIVLVPQLLDAVLPEREWATEAASGSAVDIVSADGTVVDVTVPDGWESQDEGNRVYLRGEDTTVIVGVYDREGRDVRALADRLMRLDRIRGTTSTWDGGRISSSNGSLTGDTCVTVIVDDSTGTCAFVADDDVVISVVSLAAPGAAARPVQDVIDTITRSTE